MKSNSMTRIALAFVLSISLIATGCSAQWVSVALADLPVLTQMALNIAALVATPIESISNRESGNRSSLPREDTFRCSMPAASGSRSRPEVNLRFQSRSEAGDSAATWERQSGGKVSSDFSYFLRQRTPSLVISTRSPAEVSSARIASEA